jgi:glycosyltransferase involved in cell wall biosynthesis
MNKIGHIVIVSPSYGGAEKRFFDIFTSLVRSGRPVRFIAPSGLIEKFQTDYPERNDIFLSMIPVPLPEWTRLGFINSFRQVLRAIPRGSNFHYPLNCLWPLHLLRDDSISMSVVDCTTVPTPFSRKQADVWHWLSFPFVKGIDVLSPAIFKATQRPRLQGRIKLTPGGTYLVPPAQSTSDKLPQVVFLGRLVPGKGIEDLLRVLPDLWQQLQAHFGTTCQFKIAGYGALESFVAGSVEKLRQSGIPVAFVGYQEATPLLDESSLVLSLQEVTNFPSRVVPEALLAGCAVVVRDTGDSREFGTGLPGLAYCGAKLDAAELAELISNYVTQISQNVQFRETVRTEAVKRFSSPSYIDYFATIIFDAPAQESSPRVE